MIGIQLKLLFSPCLVSWPFLPHPSPTPLGPKVDVFYFGGGGRGGILASCQHLESFAGGIGVQGGGFLSLISGSMWGRVYVFANALLHLSLSSLLCNSTLHPNLLYKVHFTCIRNTCFLFCLLPPKPVLSSPSLSSLSSLYRSRKSQMEQAWPAFSSGLKSSVQSLWLLRGNVNTILQVYVAITCLFSAVHSPCATSNHWIRDVWRHILPTLLVSTYGTVVNFLYNTPLILDVIPEKKKLTFFRDKFT